MRKVILVLLSSMLLAACASTSAIQTDLPLAKSLKGYSSIAVEVTTANSDIDTDNLAKVRKNLTEAIMTKLEATSQLRSADPANAQLKLEVSVLDLSYTSAAGRAVFAAASGHAILKTDTQLLDAKSGDKLWELHTDVASTTAEGMFGPSSTQEIETLSQQIVAEMQKQL